jgi:hypothetical protein
MKPREGAWGFKATPEFLARLRTASDVLDIPASQIAREAINEKLERLSKENRRLAEALKELPA